MEKFRSYLPLNFDLMANPVNWIIITLMILFAGFAFSVIVSASVSTQED